MNREEFDIWQKGIYETINEASIIGLSQLKGDVGTHNNRTPEQIKANNEKQASLRAKAVEKMKSAASKSGEAIKNGAKAVAQKTGEVVNKAKNALAGRDDRPIGLSGLNKKPNTDSNSAHKPTPNGAGVNKGNASSTASKFAKGVQNAQANPAPQPNVTAKDDDNKKVKTTTKVQPKASKKPNAPQLKTDDNKTVTDTVLKHTKGEGGEKKSLGQKLKDTAKKAIKGANDLKWKAQDAKNFVKDTWNSRDAANKRARGIKDEPKAEEKKGEYKENLNKKNNNPQQSNNNRTTASNFNRGSSNGGSTVHVHVTNHNDEHAQKNAQAKADAEKDREEFFKGVNHKTKGEATKGEKGAEPNAETNTPTEEKKESKAKKLSKTTPKTIGKKGGSKPEDKAEGNKEEKPDLKSKAKEAKQLSFLTKSGKIDKKYIQKDNEGSKPEVKADTQPEAKPETKTDAKPDLKSKAKEAKQLSFLTKSGNISKKYIQKDNEGSKPEVKADNKPETNAETNTPTEEKKDNNQSTAETGDKKTNQGKGATNKGKGETNSTENNKKNNKGEEQSKNTPKTIKEIPMDQQSRGKKDLSNEKPTQVLEPGDAGGSHTLQHARTTGKEASMYTDEKTGKDVPATPADKQAQDKANGKADVGARTDKKVIVVKKNKTEDKSAEEKKDESQAEEKKNEPQAEEKKAEVNDKGQKLLKYNSLPGQREKDKENASKVGNTKGGKEVAGKDEIEKHNNVVRYGEHNDKTSKMNKIKKRYNEHEGDSDKIEAHKALTKKMAEYAKTHSKEDSDKMRNKVKEVYKSKLSDREKKRGDKEESSKKTGFAKLAMKEKKKEKSAEKKNSKPKKISLANIGKKKD